MVASRQEGKHCLNASSHFGFAPQAEAAGQHCPNEILFLGEDSSHVSASAVTLMFGWPSNPFSIVSFPRYCDRRRLCRAS
jgi:hypothetical protein